MKIILYKIIAGVKTNFFEMTCLSDKNAIIVVESFYERCGLIGRFYCETESGFTFSINK